MGKRKVAGKKGPSMLSDREAEVLKCVKSGNTNRQISDSIGISENTVKFHIKNIRKKLKAANKCHAVAIAAEKGLL